MPKRRAATSDDPSKSPRSASGPTRSRPRTSSSTTALRLNLTLLLERLRSAIRSVTSSASRSSCFRRRHRDHSGCRARVQSQSDSGAHDRRATRRCSIRASTASCLTRPDAASRGRSLPRSAACERATINVDRGLRERSDRSNSAARKAPKWSDHGRPRVRLPHRKSRLRELGHDHAAHRLHVAVAHLLPSLQSARPRQRALRQPRRPPRVGERGQPVVDRDLHPQRDRRRCREQHLPRSRSGRRAVAGSVPGAEAGRNPRRLPVLRRRLRAGFCVALCSPYGSTASLGRLRGVFRPASSLPFARRTGVRLRSGAYAASSGRLLRCLSLAVREYGFAQAPRSRPESARVGSVVPSLGSQRLGRAPAEICSSQCGAVALRGVFGPASALPFARRTGVRLRSGAYAAASGRLLRCLSLAVREYGFAQAPRSRPESARVGSVVPSLGSQRLGRAPAERSARLSTALCS